MVIHCVRVVFHYLPLVDCIGRTTMALTLVRYHALLKPGAVRLPSRIIDALSPRGGSLTPLMRSSLKVRHAASPPVRDTLPGSVYRCTYRLPSLAKMAYGTPTRRPVRPSCPT